MQNARIFNIYKTAYNTKMIYNKDRYGGVIGRPIRPVNDYSCIHRQKFQQRKHNFQAPKTSQNLVHLSH